MSIEIELTALLIGGRFSILMCTLLVVQNVKLNHMVFKAKLTANSTHSNYAKKGVIWVT